MNQSVITGLGTPQLSRIIEEGDEYSRRTDQPSLYNPTDRNGRGDHDQESELDRIEKEIGEIGKQLQMIHLQLKRILDKYSEDYMEKEGRRNTLRKRLIDLDFSHKTILAKRIRRNNANSIIHQFYEPQNQQHPTPPRSSEKLPAKDRNEATSQRLTKFASPTKSYKAEQYKKSEKRLQGSQRRVRTVQRDNEAGQGKLGKSRVDQLTRQLVQLQAAYSSPYLSSYYYPAYDDYYSDLWPY